MCMRPNNPSTIYLSQCFFKGYLSQCMFDFYGSVAANANGTNLDLSLFGTIFWICYRSILKFSSIVDI